ncbi:hypothetical protein [Siminovitchia sp. 179-K 8D1 HS]|uniref:hypothetical protein n=1 Tax=Siminovitchia sp. 179-K 8D1 HS TaxID=3142385 RepID=UPI00399F5DD7
MDTIQEMNCITTEKTIKDIDEREGELVLVFKDGSEIHIDKRNNHWTYRFFMRPCG